VSKTDDLAQKHEDARLLRVDIDERSRPIVCMLRQALTPGEFSDYEYFILMKSQLPVELQDVEHAIQLGDRQLQKLHSSASALSMHSSDC
jgi:Apx/Shroom domain ASD2